jgi:Ig-like domain CHU_C associated
MKKFLLFAFLLFVSLQSFAVDTITLGTLSSTNYCIYTPISVPFTSTLPSGTQFTARLKKGTTIIWSSTGNASPITVYPGGANIVYGTDYTVDVIAGSISSAESPQLTVGIISNVFVSDGENQQVYFGFESICTGKSKTYFATVKDSYNNILTQNITYQWKKDGVNIVGAINNNYTATESGLYTFVATSGGCNFTAYGINLSFSTSSLSSILKVEGDNFACNGTEKRLQATYVSNSSTYQWYRDGTAISGATNRVLPATLSGNYSVNIFDGACIGSTGSKQITFSNSLYAPIFASNTDTTICNGSGVQLIGNSVYEFPNQYQYQWQRDGINIAPEQYYSSTGVGYYARQAGYYSLIYKQGSCITTSRKIQVVNSNLAQKPAITIQNGFDICQGNVKISQVNEANSMMGFSSNSGGSIYGGIYGKWFKDGAEIPNSANTSYTTNQAGIYKLQVGYGTCINESNEISLTFASPIMPKLISSNNKTNICGNSDYVSLYVDTNNMPNTNFTYIWQKDGITIPNQTSNNLYVNSSGVYTVIFGNGTCSGVSNSITITNSNAFSLLSNANNLTCTNQLVKLTPYNAVSFINSSIVWKLNDNVIANETGNTLFASLPGSYTASINQNGCVATSAPFVLNTNDVPLTPIVAPVTINNGETATLTATGCTGTVKWYNVSGGGNSLFTGNTFTSPVLISNTKYYADCSNATCTSIERKSVQVMVIGGVGPITLGNVSINACKNSNFSVPFSTTLPSGTVFTASLYKAGQLITSATGTTSPILINLNNFNINFGTDYTVKVAAGSETSLESANITMGMLSFVANDDGYGNNYSQQFLCPGKEKILYSKIYYNSGLADSPLGITYQWQKDNVDISGATSSNLVVSEAANYTIKAYQGSCVVSSNPVQLVVTTNITSYFNYPYDLACENSTIDLTALYYSNSATYQWQKNGIDIGGAINRQFAANSSGLYSLKTFDGACQATSQQTKLTFSSGVLVSLYTSSGDTTLCGNNTISLFANSTPNSSNYIWQKDGVIFSNPNSRQFNTNQPGEYSVTYQQGSCISKSKPLTIVNSTKFQKPYIVTSSLNTICAGTVRIGQNLAFDQLNSRYFYLIGNWYKDGILIPNANTGEFTATTTGAYKMVYGSGSCANESNTVNVTIGGSSFVPKIKLNNFNTTPNVCGYNGLVQMELDNFNNATNLSNVSYQWRINGQNIPGGTNSSFNASGPGEYSLFVVNDNCSAVSNTITITGNQEVTINSLENNFYCANRVVKLRTNLPEYSNINSVIWKRDGVVVPNETSAYMYALLPGNYTASVNSNGCNATSNPFTLNIATPSTLYTTKSGNWNDPLCWICGQLPNATTPVKISNGHIINVPAGIYPVKNVTLEGTVNFETGAEVKVTGN